jgi:hypothetical protein
MLGNLEGFQRTDVDLGYGSLNEWHSLALGLCKHVTNILLAHQAQEQTRFALIVKSQKVGSHLNRLPKE